MNHILFSEKMRDLVKHAEEKIKQQHEATDEIALINQARVLDSYAKHQVADFHFTPSTGYGYDDAGRDTLERIYADVFGGEAALVRNQIVSGTHAIAVALFGVLRPGDELLYITGTPYDTLEEIVGIRGNKKGSLQDFQITYQKVDLHEGSFNKEAIKQAIGPNTKMIGIQRSKGYGDRPSFFIAEIKDIIAYVKSIKSDVVVFVDNCYGEFVETAEPCHVGADLIAGSLIKNPGGGIAKTGGYLVGREDLIELASYRLAAPGIGAEGGASLYTLLDMYQGFFLAPHVVAQSVKGAYYTASLLEEVGMKTEPASTDKRTDLIQAVHFQSAEQMVAFCQAIQHASPINAHVTPTPSYMPGYADDVIMAAGTFVQGASIELTADGPLRPPYAAYVQGGLTYEHIKLAVTKAVEKTFINDSKREAE
ncbi:cystathionine beta-lyase family protein involved in aluminum resistance [Alkalihalobacillus xiaoxiensis]|uniref:Cystathionine beta-lyase family protein involved in aluminum resistance n=2 Tax=Shouchella xiaoxiensis TaxID=766895 RepID=A0ABS2SQE4_9BACI|nr:cystathionine beta-lyase family protein involved in aluminum resistance [Shouchella xiaoxiensis]